MDDGACHGQTELMFPAQYDYDGTLAAKALCAGCPVRAECLEYALAERIKHGIWGGMSERQRRGLRPRDLPRRPRADLGRGAGRHATKPLEVRELPEPGSAWPLPTWRPSGEPLAG